MNNFRQVTSEKLPDVDFIDIENDIKTNYKQPGHPIAFAGIQQIYSYYNRKIPISRIKEILSGIESYTLHREFHQQERNTSFSKFKRYQFQMDLVEVQQLSKSNDNIRYLLNVIDTFTRYAFVRPLKDKKAETVLDQFKSILVEAKQKPFMIVMDKGTEFMNKLFSTFCQKENIKLVNPQANIHAAYIERFNRTLQEIIYKYMTENETSRYIDVLQRLVQTYNMRKHRIINMSPNAAENDPENHLKINLNAIKEESLKKKRKRKYNVGSFVRIAKQKGKFSRSYQEQTAQEIFKIFKVDESKRIPLYHLETYNGDEQIKGGFYDFELTPVSTDIFRIEKVLKTKKNNRGQKLFFVKWKGFDQKYNSWINENDVEQEF